MTARPLVAGIGLILLAAIGWLGGASGLVDTAPWLTGGGIALLAYAALTLTYIPSGATWPAPAAEPRRLAASPIDWAKALWCWIDGYHRTYATRPGLYFTGDRYDLSAPLLVTCNYHLTVCFLAHKLRHQAVRLLVIDTDGINVWCSAGKGSFCAEEIHRLVAAYASYDRSLLGAQEKISMVLPKLALSGIDLRALRRGKIRPIIGPVHGADLPAYLAAGELSDCDDARLRFDVRSRMFTWLPGFVQFCAYGTLLLTALLALRLAWPFPLPVGLIAIVALIATAYPLLFPWLPGKRFAVKGAWLGAAVAAGIAGYSLALNASLRFLPAAMLFAGATGIFFGLSYTGNSAVSNYTRVRKEISLFLPINLLLYLLTMLLFALAVVRG